MGRNVWRVGRWGGALEWGVDVYASRVWMRMIKGCGCV